MKMGEANTEISIFLTYTYCLADVGSVTNSWDCSSRVYLSKVILKDLSLFYEYLFTLQSEPSQFFISCDISCGSEAASASCDIAFM